MVVATDRYVAEDVAERIVVTYEPLPVVVDMEQGEVAAHLAQEVGDVEAALARAPHVEELRLDIERSASTPLEGRGVYARWDAHDESLRVYSSTQTPTSVRFAVAAILGLPDSQVECVAPDVGGGFGVKIMHPWPEEILVPWAAMTLGRPVKFTEDRREHFVSATHERGQVQHVRVGFDADGRILGLDVRFLHDNGAYTPYGIIVPIITSTQLPGPYRLPAYRVEFSSVYTNTVPVTPYRGAGRPQGAFCMERTVDRIAAVLGLDRAEVRRRNFVQPEEMPYDVGLTFQDGRPTIYDSGDFPASLAKLLDLVGWDDFPRRRAEAAAQGRRLGIGLACYVEGTGVGPYEGGHVQVEPNGRVNVSTGLSSQGQGHETVFAQIVASELGVPLSDVHVRTGRVNCVAAFDSSLKE
jgi:CO/xanthine dehydrogenase Mo-binding subunit